MNCPNKNFRGENCVYLTSFGEINKSTYECKHCKPCSHVPNILFKDQKSCVTLFAWTYCFKKKTKLEYQKEKLSPLMRQYIQQSKVSTTKQRKMKMNLFQKNKGITLYGIIVSRSYWPFYYNTN